MKKSILVFAASVFISAALLTGCNTPAENVADAQNNLNDANKDLDKANQDYKADVEKFRKEAADKIATNERSIAEFNARIANEKKDADADYKKKIAELEQTNSDMKKKMDDYKMEGKDKWETFKAEFSHGMDQLGKSFKDLTVRTVK